MKDQAIETILAVRRKISEEYGHDIKAFLDHYRELESQYKNRLVEGKQVQGVLPIHYLTLSPTSNPEALDFSVNQGTPLRKMSGSKITERKTAKQAEERIA